MSPRPRDPLHLLACALIGAVILVLPWPVGRVGNGQTFAGAVAATTRELHRSAYSALAAHQAFRANLDTPGSGEDVLPVRVREGLSILGNEGSGVRRYAMSAGISGNLWVFQQMVASAWPRKLESGAEARFQLVSEPLPPGCSVIASRKEVLLAYCP
jgi:hypothetical protein